MAIYQAFDAILEGSEATEENAIDFARGFVWCECESSEQSIGYAQHVETIDGIGIYYDYGADYYFFTDEEK